jgi:hypothetical protein
MNEFAFSAPRCFPYVSAAMINVRQSVFGLDETPRSVPEARHAEAP